VGTRSKWRGKPARAVPLDRVNDAQRLDHELWPNRRQGGIGPIERRMRELGGVQALVVGAFAEHSVGVHALLGSAGGAGSATRACGRERGVGRRCEEGVRAGRAVPCVLLRGHRVSGWLCGKPAGPLSLFRRIH
jgi:hypothetical protein